jgi:hypothetical protein
MKNHRSTIQSLLFGLLIVVLICGGCQKTEEGEKEADETAAAQTVTAEEPTPPKPVEPPPKPVIPKAKFTEQLKETNLLKVGDVMPNAELRDMSGSYKLTVICFWDSEGTSGLQAISELEKYIVEPYAEKGVAVIGINPRDQQWTIKEKAKLAEAKFPMLQDDGAYFNKVATEMLPRVYLIDSNGKILWFDTEYSRTMRRDLTQGIDAALEK